MARKSTSDNCKEDCDKCSKKMNLGDNVYCNNKSSKHYGKEVRYGTIVKVQKDR